MVELRQQMTPSMVAIQMAILQVMKACVTELKTVNPSVCDLFSFLFFLTLSVFIRTFLFVCTPQLDTEEVTVENCLGKTFDQIVKLHLDPVWNQLVWE